MFRPQRDLLSGLLTFDIGWQLAESLLQKADKMSMGASIELRTPILDVGVADVAARIPSDLKLPRGGPGKKILRTTVANRIVEPIDRPKKGFPVPLREWLSGPLRELIEGDLFSTGSAIGQRLDRKILKQAWDDFINGWDGARAFYGLWLYERWQRGMAA